MNVGVADLKSRLSAHLRAVREGTELTVVDRGHPIARLVPLDEEGPLVVREPKASAGRLQDVPLPKPRKVLTDIVALLLEDRNSGR